MEDNMKFQVRVFLLFIFVFGFSYFSLATSANDEKDNPAGMQDEIILNYQTGSVTPYKVCKLKDGQILKVTIKALAPGANYSIDVSGTEKVHILIRSVFEKLQNNWVSAQRLPIVSNVEQTRMAQSRR